MGWARKASSTVRIGVGILLVATLVAMGSHAVASVGGSASFALSPASITYGQSFSASGVVEAGSGCESGREVDLQRRLPGSTDWKAVATTTSRPNGSFDFSRQPWYTASYRAAVIEDDRGTIVCSAVNSPIATNRVVAAVSLTPVPSPVIAGDCTSARVHVLPPKPGETALIQVKKPAGWKTFDQVKLDANSRGAPSLCYGWASIGIYHLRAVWTQQDRLNLPGGSGAVALDVVEAPWMKKIDRLTAGHFVSVDIQLGGQVLYQRGQNSKHAPASNEKLLQSMALLDRFGPSKRLPTVAAARAASGGVVHGDLWVLGYGNPENPARSVGALARAIVAAGVSRVTGSVRGSTGYFSHDWFAPGWRPDFPAQDVALPTALTFRHNTFRGVHVRDPERRLAEALTAKLKLLGVKVRGKPGAGVAPGGLGKVAQIRSLPLRTLLRHQNLGSDNFDAEVLGKLLGAAASGAPGTIAKGAAAIEDWAASNGVKVVAHDSSGLSYRNRVTAAGLVSLLSAADGAPWGEVLRMSLATPGHGTLENRLGGVPVHAKTGTLRDISALSGWVYLQKTDAWGAFSILSGGFNVSSEKDLEDAIVRTFWKYAR